MDYVDYKNFIYASWKSDKKSHRNRIDAILTSASTRIDNKPSEHHYTAPCKHKKIGKIDRNIVADNEKYQNSIKEILNKDIYKGVKTQIEKMNGLGCIKKNLKKSYKPDVEDEN